MNEIKHTLKNPSQSDFADLFESMDINNILGYKENEIFDVKSEFYNLQDPKSKIEICKDLSAFANYKGGYIIFGCKEKVYENILGSYVYSFVPEQVIIDENQVRQILQSHVYPNTLGQNIEFIKFYLGQIYINCIKINSIQSEVPYLVKNENKQLEYFGYFFRSGDGIPLIDIRYIHELVQKGINYNEYISKVEGKIDRVISNTEKSNTNILTEDTLEKDL